MVTARGRYHPALNDSTSATFSCSVTDGVTPVTTSASLDIIDTAAPAAVATVTGLSADTGTVGDFITSVASQTVSGSHTGTLLAGEKIQVSTDGNIWIDATAASGAWSASGVTLAAGTGTLSVRTIDAANNTTAGTGHSYTLDQTAPVAAVAITAIATDTGTAGDFITSDTTLVVSGTNGTLGAGERVQISSDGSNWFDVTQTTGTTWSYDDAGNPHLSNVTYQVRVIDVAANVGSTASQLVIVDTAAPAAGTLSFSNLTDTGRQHAAGDAGQCVRSVAGGPGNRGGHDDGLSGLGERRGLCRDRRRARARWRMGATCSAR